MFRVFVARRSPCWPGSASSTTRASSGATPAASPRMCWRRSARPLQLNEAEHAHLARPRPCRERRTAAAPNNRPLRGAVEHPPDHRCNVGVPRRSFAMAAWTTCTRTVSSRRSTPTCTAIRLRPANAARSPPVPRPSRPNGDSTRTGTRSSEISVAGLRSEAGRNPYDRGLSDLVGLLSTRSEVFRTLWARHDVYLHRGGMKRFRHRLSATSRSATRPSPCRPIRGWRS